MNRLEFSQKKFYFYSLRQNRLLDFSMATDEQFDRIESAFQSFKCESGNTFSGHFVYTGNEASVFDSLEAELSGVLPQVFSVRSCFKDFEAGDKFCLNSANVPVLNRICALGYLNSKHLGMTEQEMHRIIMLTFGFLDSEYEHNHYSFGFDGIAIKVGQKSRTKRVCRFCGRTTSSNPPTRFDAIAHAIPEGLGNSLLFCNEECDECNSNLKYLEENLMTYMDFRRSFHEVKTKSTSLPPRVDGVEFVTVPDSTTGRTVLYLKKECLPNPIPAVPFRMRLNHTKSIRHQNVYKALCKIAIDLMPTDRLVHFKQTIDWINNSLFCPEMPSVKEGYMRLMLPQPAFGLYFSDKEDEPYCTAALYLLDMCFIYILPFADVDKGRYKSDSSLTSHWNHWSQFMGSSLFWGWNKFDTTEITESIPWIDWVINPKDPNVKVLPESDPIFVPFDLDKYIPTEHVFPPFIPEDISLKSIQIEKFEKYFWRTLTEEELHDVSIIFNQLSCFLSPEQSTAVIVADLDFSNTDGSEPYFSVRFNVTFGLRDFQKHIDITHDSISINCELRDALLGVAFIAADKKLEPQVSGTNLEKLKLIKAVEDIPSRRHLTYYIDGYPPIPDNRIHPI